MNKHFYQFMTGICGVLAMSGCMFWTVFFDMHLSMKILCITMFMILGVSFLAVIFDVF